MCFKDKQDGWVIYCELPKFLTQLPDEQTQTYGKKMLSAVKGMFKHIHDAEQMSQTDFQSAMEKAKAQILRIAINEVPSRINDNGKEELNEAQNMANRFRLHGEACFRFITTRGPSVWVSCSQQECFPAAQGQI
jgi:hypothetical protein